MKQSLFSQIGIEVIREAVTLFYQKAFSDPIIGHFFFHQEKEELIRKQTDFICKMLGGPASAYRGKPMKIAHAKLPLTQVHFNRRQVLMKEVLDTLAIDESVKTAWLAHEEKLRSLVINSQHHCKN